MALGRRDTLAKKSDELWVRRSVSSIPVYVGIDVACAAGKRLPICVVSAGQPIMPLAIPKHLGAAIPRGVGNKEITALAPFREAALGVAGSINRVALEMGWHVERAAVDAPAAPPEASSRTSEDELGRLGLSSFRTPAASAWDGIKHKCVEHLGSGGSTATLPHANNLDAVRLRALQFPQSRSLGSRSSRYIRLLSSGRCYPPASTSRRSRAIGISSSRSPLAQGGDRRISKPNYGRRCQEVVTIAWTHSWQLGLPPCRGNSGARSAMLSSRMTLSGYLCRLRSATWSKP